MLTQYPQGTSSFGGVTASMTSSLGSAGISAGASGNGGGSPMAAFGSPDTIGARMQELSRAQKIAADSGQHPQDALANVSTLSEGMMRCNALSGIARANVKKNSAAAAPHLTAC